jgi:methenyltetrahydromethanopterin cyclohydrolase
MSLNERGYRVAEALVGRAGGAGVACHDRGGVRVVDCGVQQPGSVEAGLALARVALADLGDASLREPPGSCGDAWPDCPWPVVSVSSERPVAACLAAQYAGWKVAAAKFFAMASGPIRAAIGREDLFDTIGMREQPSVAVGLLESARLPPEEVCLELAAAAGVDPGHLILLVARTASLAGTLQVVARSLETALHKLHDLHFDLGLIRRGSGAAPLPPLPAPPDDLVAIGRTNDAILYGGHVVLEVAADDDTLKEVGPRMVSAASASYGESFLQLFEQAGRDFYALDPALFAPAVVDLVAAESGRRHRFGAVAPEIVARSFAARES